MQASDLLQYSWLLCVVTCYPPSWETCETGLATHILCVRRVLIDSLQQVPTLIKKKAVERSSLLAPHLKLQNLPNVTAGAL